MKGSGGLTPSIIDIDRLNRELEAATPQQLPELADRVRRLVAGEGPGSPSDGGLADYHDTLDRFLSVGSLRLADGAEPGLARLIEEFSGCWLSAETSKRFAKAMDDYTAEQIRRQDEVDRLTLEIAGLRDLAGLLKSYLSLLNTLEPGASGPD